MNKEALKYELKKFTKEEIINAIADTDKILANRVMAVLIRTKSKDLDKLVATAFDEWDKASHEYIAYINQIKEEFKGVPILQLPKEVRDKMLALSAAEDKADKHLQAMYDEQEKLYKMRV